MTNPGADRIKELLLAEELDQLQSLRNRLEDPHEFSREVSYVLPEAFKRATEQSDQISKSMVPVIEQTIFKSVSRNPRPMADALFPVIGPAIRKSISEALRAFLQNLNQILENSISFRSLKWRFEAFVSRRSYAEILLSRSLLFRVRELFLIHRNSGILLSHLCAENVSAKDGDMVSGMLSAIRDFVNDSFGENRQQELEMIQVGELMVWIVPGPQAFLAGVIEGQAPERLRSEFHEVLETIHLSYALELDEFNGDIRSFTGAEEEMRVILKQVIRSNQTRSNLWGWVFIGSLLFLLCSYFAFRLERQYRWEKTVKMLKAQDGLWITQSGREHGYFFVEGLKDPLANIPMSAIHEAGFDTSRIHFLLEPFSSSNPQIVARRVRKVFHVPESVSLKVVDGTLHIEGSLTNATMKEIRDKALLLGGISSLDFSALIILEKMNLEEVKSQIESTFIFFESEEWGLRRKEEEKVEIISRQINELLLQGEQLDLYFVIDVYGYSDPKGQENMNRELSRKRAESVAVMLKRNGIDNTLIRVNGKGLDCIGAQYPRRVEIHIQQQ